MRCDAALGRIAPLVDHQLDVIRACAVRHHLAGCSTCAQAHESALALRQRIRRHARRYTVPAELRAAITARHATSSPMPIARSAVPIRWAAGGAAAGALLTVAVLLGSRAIGDWRAGQDLVRMAVDAHTHAMLDHGTIQVASSDHHTIKPWLSARLDYSPPVKDHAAEGFALAGARIEDLGGRRVATLVYHYRAHVIDVFVAPLGSSSAGVRTSTVRGFNTIRTQGNDMDWMIVSDVNLASLGAFAQSLAADGPAEPATIRK